MSFPEKLACIGCDGAFEKQQFAQRKPKTYQVFSLELFWKNELFEDRDGLLLIFASSVLRQ